MSGLSPVAGNLVLAGFGLVAIMAAMIPLAPGGALGPPDILWCVVVAFAVRRPGAAPAWLIVALGLAADLMLSRPLGLGALALFLSAETMRIAASTSFPVMGMPRRRTRYSPDRTFPASSTGMPSPATRASFPPGRIVTPSVRSMALRWASFTPKRSRRTEPSSNRIVSSLASFTAPASRIRRSPPTP